MCYAKAMYMNGCSNKRADMTNYLRSLRTAGVDEACVTYVTS